MRLAVVGGMHPALDPSSPTIPSFFDHFPAAATVPNHALKQRKIAFWSSLLVIPAAAAVGVLLGPRRASFVSGGLAALTLALVRWQFGRWFTETPAYETLGQVGALELRRYPLWIEARVETDATDVETAIDRGFGRLACYTCGANTADERLRTTTPILTTMRDGVYTTAFVMPPNRPISSLPRPDDPRLVLRELAGRKLAVYPFRGRLTRDRIELHERRFLRALLDAGLVARGSVTVATYDSPATLPALRRNELWIAIA